MNIWILNHHARDYGRHPSLAKYLTESGEQVQLFSASFLHNTFKESKRYDKNQYYVEETHNDYNRVYIKTPKYQGNGIKRLINQLVFSYRAYKVGKKKIRTESTPQIIIGSSVHLFTGVAAYFLTRKANAKFIFEIRDVWPQTLVDLGALKKNSLPTKTFEFIEKFLYKRADLIVSVLPDGEKHIVKYGIDTSKVMYLPNGIDVSVFEDSLKSENLSPELTQYFERNKEKFILTYAGSHGNANGLDTLIRSAKLLESEKDIEFLFVGDGPEKKKVLDLAKKLNLNNVTFIDRVEKNQVAIILEKSDGCIFHLNRTPVFNYGISSNKLFDYMISAKPMIFAVETSFNFVEASKNGISVAPESPEDMSNAIKSLVSQDVQVLKEMGENGKDFVIKNHDYKILSKQLIERLKLIK